MAWNGLPHIYLEATNARPGAKPVSPLTLPKDQRVNRTVLLAGLLPAALAAAADAPASAGAPYPRSAVVTGLSWGTSTHRDGGHGGDIWPITWHADGTLRAAYGDGQIGCPKKVSHGVVSIASDAPGTGMQPAGCGPVGTGKGKIRSLVSAAGHLHAALNPQGSTSGHPILRSTDGGRSWTRGWSPTWLADSFVNVGRGNAGAPDGHLYFLHRSGGALHLGRVQPSAWNVGTAYQWFSGTAAAPAWSGSKGAAKPIFADPAGADRPNIEYVPGLRRHLLTAARSGPGKVGVFESENMWGPWRTVYYAENWLGLGTRGAFLGIHFPVKWQSADGRTLWATFSCHDAGERGACGKYHDRLNLMRVTLGVAGR
jgi:hypothetical protein